MVNSYRSSNLHGITLCKTVIFIVTAERASNLVLLQLYSRLKSSVAISRHIGIVLFNYEPWKPNHRLHKKWKPVMVQIFCFSNDCLVVDFFNDGISAAEVMVSLNVRMILEYKFGNYMEGRGLGRFQTSIHPNIIYTSTPWFVPFRFPTNSTCICISAMPATCSTIPSSFILLLQNYTMKNVKYEASSLCFLHLSDFSSLLSTHISLSTIFSNEPNVRFGVLKELNTEFTVFCDATPCICWKKPASPVFRAHLLL